MIIGVKRWRPLQVLILGALFAVKVYGASDRGLFGWNQSLWTPLSNILSLYHSTKLLRLLNTMLGILNFQLLLNVVICYPQRGGHPVVPRGYDISFVTPQITSVVCLSISSHNSTPVAD